MNIPDNKKLKDAIFKELKDIFISEDNIPHQFTRKKGYIEVRPTEWEHAVWLCESRLSESSRLDYINYLRMYHEQRDDLKTIHWFAVINSSWQVKATCLFLARGISV